MRLASLPLAILPASVLLCNDSNGLRLASLPLAIPPASVLLCNDSDGLQLASLPPAIPPASVLLCNDSNGLRLASLPLAILHNIRISGRLRAPFMLILWQIMKAPVHFCASTKCHRGFIILESLHHKQYFIDILHVSFCHIRFIQLHAV